MSKKLILLLLLILLVIICPSLASSLIQNPGFETGDYSNWTTHTNLVVSTDNKLTGEYGIGDTSSVSKSFSLVSECVDTTIGTEYSYWVKATGTYYNDGVNNVFLIKDCSSGTTRVTCNNTLTTDGEWYQKTCVNTWGNGSVKLNFISRVYSGAHILMIDHFQPSTLDDYSDIAFTATINPYYFNYNSTAQLIVTGGDDLTLDPAHVEVCSEERSECVINKNMTWTCLADTCFINADFFINAYGRWTVEAWFYIDGEEFYATDEVEVMIEYDYPLPNEVDFLPDHIPGYNSTFNASYYIETYINSSIFDNTWILGYFGIWDSVLDPLEDAFGFLFGILTTPLNWITSAVETAFVVISDTMTLFMEISSPLMYMIFQITSNLPNSFIGVVSFSLALDTILLFIRSV